MSVFEPASMLQYANYQSELGEGEMEAMRHRSDCIDEFRLMNVPFEFRLMNVPSEFRLMKAPFWFRSGEV